MLEIILLAYLSFRNGVRARQKGLNAVLWGGLTVLSFFFAFSLGFGIVIVNFLPEYVNLQQLSSPDLKVRVAAMQPLIEQFTANPLHYITVEMFGIGGYLLIRYILERKPNKKAPEVHWMDKLEENG